ncbi:MAG: hypothetical protein JJE28_03210 [Actinomycetales bacterium]|nr:hypothetical protein [Actinomycetales bacterium]
MSERKAVTKKKALAYTATIRRKIINIPARIASSARKITLHLPENWPWETGWVALFTSSCGPPTTPRSLTTPDNPSFADMSSRCHVGRVVIKLIAPMFPIDLNFHLRIEITSSATTI